MEDELFVMLDTTLSFAGENSAAAQYSNAEKALEGLSAEWVSHV